MIRIFQRRAHKSIIELKGTMRAAFAQAARTYEELIAHPNPLVSYAACNHERLYTDIKPYLDESYQLNQSLGELDQAIGLILDVGSLGKLDKRGLKKIHTIDFIKIILRAQNTEKGLRSAFHAMAQTDLSEKMSDEDLVTLEQAREKIQELCEKNVVKGVDSAGTSFKSTLIPEHMKYLEQINFLDPDEIQALKDEYELGNYSDRLSAMGYMLVMLNRHIDLSFNTPAPQ